MKASNKTIWLIALLILFAYTPLSAQNEIPEESSQTETIFEESETDKFQETEEELEQIEDEYRELFDNRETTAEDAVKEPVESPQESFVSEPVYEADKTAWAALGIDPFSIKKFQPVKLGKDDFASIVFSRAMRTPVAALENPSNLAVASQTRWGLTLPLPLPVPTMGVSVQNSSFDLGTYNKYLSLIHI